MNNEIYLKTPENYEYIMTLIDNNKKLGKEIERLKEENMILQNASDEVEVELQQRIDKAIEYIEKNSYTTFETIEDINYFIVRLDKCEDLLDILKGEDKE